MEVKERKEAVAKKVRLATSMLSQLLQLLEHKEIIDVVVANIKDYQVDDDAYNASVAAREVSLELTILYDYNKDVVSKAD